MLKYTKDGALPAGFPTEVSPVAMSPAAETSKPKMQSTKRLFDIVSSVLIIALIIPFILAIVAILLTLQGRPIFIKHTRIGLKGRRFSCYKFRTMVVGADKALQDYLHLNPGARNEWDATRKLKDDPRITPIGRVLRKASVDEIPQLFNVFRGDMSLVGPRPIVDTEMKYYGTAIQKYLAVRPGLTGLWQISGRNDVSYSSRVKLDLEYIERCNILFDLLIIARTLPAVVRLKGSY